MQPSLTVGRHLVWRILLILALISMPMQSIVPAFALTVTTQPGSDPSQPPDQPKVQIKGPQVDAALEAAPRPDQALVVDRTNPNWITRYGTEAGRQLLPPRQPDVPATINGATPPLSGFWLTTTLQSGTNGVTAIAYAPDGRLFVALSGNGLRVYGPDATGNYLWTSITASVGGLLSNNVTALAIFNNKLWIGTGNSGISRYDLSSGVWDSVTLANSLLPNNTINRLTPVGDAYIWISTNSGAAKYQPSGQFIIWNIINSADSPLIGDQMFDVAVDINGSTTTTWFATNIGLTSWNGTTFTSQGGGGCTPFFFATRVIVDRLHRVWYVPVNEIPAKPQGPNQPTGPVNEPIGLCERTVGILGIAIYTLYSTTSPGLPSNNVSDLSEDYAGRIWISMQPYNSSIGGGAVFDNGTWRLYTTSSSPLLSNDVSSVRAVGEAVWWGHGDLNALTTHSPNWLRYTATQLGGSPSALFLETTRTWAGVGNKIAYSTGGAWTSLTLPGNSSAVSSLARDASSDLWIGTFGYGIYRYNGSTFTNYTTTSGLPDNLVTALHSDQLGRIWAGTPSGLAMRAEAGYWLTFTTSTSPLINNSIIALARDGSDRLWIGTLAGISIYDLNNPGNAWSTQTIANGLPSNTVRDLARDPSGTMWAATDSGVGAYNPISGTWTIYSSTNGLPSNDTYAVSADPAGRIWVATRGGMALRQGTTWRTFHTPETSLESQRLSDVAADDNRTWIVNSAVVGVRGVLTSPIGFAVPAIASFFPISATPGATIIINGSGFDTRGAEFNLVKFPDHFNFPTLPAEVISVTATSIAVKVPSLASSGKLQIEANGLKSPLSAVLFQLQPSITSLSAGCLGLGSELKISGLGFMDGSAAAYVTIGNGTERIADATDPTQIRTFLRPGDSNGKVKVRLLNGNQTTSSASVTIATINVNQTAVQQAVQGEAMIYGKRTLVQLDATSGGCAGAQITRASLIWNFSTGLTEFGANVNFPGGKALPATQQPISINNAVSLAADLNISQVADDLNLPGSPFVSSLPFFNGATVILRNNNVDVLTLNLGKSNFNFIDTAGVRRRFIMMEVTGKTAATQSSDDFSVMMANLVHMARIYPQQDAQWYNGRYYWLYDTPMFFTMDPISFDAGGNYNDARDNVDDYLDPGGNTWAVALVDRANLAPGKYVGRGGSGWHTVVDTNLTNSGGATIMHELMHAFGFVDSDAPNYQPSNVEGEDHHSKYNEGRWSSFSDCVSSRTYRQALLDFAGGDKRVVQLFGASGPIDLRTAACNAAAAGDQGNTAKSVISYAPNRVNSNSVLEPIDYRVMINQLCEDGGCVGFTPQAATNAPTSWHAPLRLAVPVEVTRTLRLSGQIDVSDSVTTSLSYVGINDGAVTPQDPGGDYHLIVRDAGHTVLHDQVFKVIFDDTLPHDGQVNGPAAHTEAITTTVDPFFFHLRVPFPDNATQAEIVHNSNVLWSQTVSAHAPTVNLTAPNGGTFNAMDPITITWTSGDLDGDPLQFGLDYSPDNGTTWILLAPKVTGSSFTWTPKFAPASMTARLRIRASDGFNTATSVSALFSVTPRAPEAVILSPDNGATFTEGAIVNLEGASMTSDGFNAGAFIWKLNNATIGTTHTLTTALNAVGVNTITLQVNADALSDSRSITITVQPDYDRDGLPNTWEAQYQLNPLDPSDALGDADGDGLTNIQEYQLGTNPRSSDTDGDGFSDSAEVAAGTDPLSAASVPNATPILNVGSVSMGFTINAYSPLPGPESTWVTNSGGGILNWTATKDAAWLNVSPLSGSAPQELSVNANAIGLPVGVYQGHVTVTAPGVSGSPQTITVTLHIETLPALKTVYLPLILR